MNAKKPFCLDKGEIRFDERTIIEVLKYHSGDKMSARDIVEFLYKIDPEYFKKNESRRKKTYASMSKFLSQLAAELHSKVKVKEDSDVYDFNEGSSRYYMHYDFGDRLLENKSEDNLMPKKRLYNQKEHLLYPKFCEYLRETQEVFPMRINEKRSSGKRYKGKNSRRFPDIVGIEKDTLFKNEWNDDIKAILNMECGKKIGIWSVEVKVEVTPSTVRDDLMQTVINSSWASSAYLAAASFSKSQDGMPDNKVNSELTELANEHGIGVIKICENKPLESKVIIKAVKKDINWRLANTLANENDDFMRFIKIYRRYIESNTGDDEWDNMIKFLSGEGPDRC